MSDPLAIFKEKDVFPDRAPSDEGVVFEDRLTGKAVVLDDENKVALVGNKINSFYLLPGGGIDASESIEQGIIRECREEIGCKVSLVYSLGMVEDYRNRDQKHCISHGSIAKLVGEKGQPALTEDEQKNGMHVVWLSLDEAVDILEKEKGQLERGEVTFYNTGFNILRDRLFLLEARKRLNQ